MKKIISKTMIGCTTTNMTTETNGHLNLFLVSTPHSQKAHNISHGFTSLLTIKRRCRGPGIRDLSINTRGFFQTPPP